MELENQTNSTSAEASAAPESAPAQTAPAPAAPESASAATPAQGEAAATTAWTPDFKFKVMDKEHEIPELYRPLIKDENTLKEIRRLHEQALGVPHLEASRDEFKNKYAQAAPRLQEYERVEQRLNKLSHFVQNQDFGSFFSELKIPREAVLMWVKQELEAQELPPHVRQQVEQSRQLASQKWEAEQELQYYRQQAEEGLRQTRLGMIDQAITSQASDIASQFNDRMQNPLAFREAVINKGLQIQQATGQAPAPEQVIEMVKSDLVRLMGLQNVPQGTVVAPQAQAAPPVIPAIKGSGASPVKKKVTSLADLKKMANELQ